MDTRIAALTALTEALANRQTRGLEAAVKAAYAAGASRDDVLRAVETGQCLAELPAPDLTHACPTATAWEWSAAGRPGRVLPTSGPTRPPSVQ